MRKIISLMMVLAMLVSAVAVTTFGASAEMLDGKEGIDYVDALYFETAPTIDGYITEAEWGEATLELRANWCATPASTKPLYNSFFYWKNYDQQGNSITNYPMQAFVWLRWDENHYYVGVKVKDFDGHSLKNGKTETWNGDAIQFRVDRDGPNSASGGFGCEYDPSQGTPWLDPTMPDFVAGYAQIAGGFVECYDNTYDKGLTAYSNPVFGAVDIAISPSEVSSDNPLNYHDDAKAGYTTYEVAVPWKYIFENYNVPNYANLTEAEKAPYTLKYATWDYDTEPTGGIDYWLGMSLTIFNAPKGSSGYNCFMSWGSGTTNVQTDIAPGTAAGSNAVRLSGEKVVTGSYTKYDPSKLNADRANKVYDNVFYDYLDGDTGRTTPVSSANDLFTLTYDNDSDLDFWGCTRPEYYGTTMDVGGDHGKVLSFDRMVVDKPDADPPRYAGVDPIDSFYLDTSFDPENSIVYPLSYTFEFDIKYTGVEVVQEGRASELGNWFGGADGYSYYCGYSFTDKRFIIIDNADPTTWIASSEKFDLVKDQWYNWKFQYDNDTCTVRLLIDDEVIFNVYNRYFNYSGDHFAEQGGSMLYFWFINTQMKMDNVKIYNFYDYVHKTSTEVEGDNNNSGPSGNGNVNRPGNQTQTGGDKIDVEVSEKEDGTFEIGVNAKKDYKTVTSLSYTIKFDTAKFNLKGINGLEEGDYKLEQAEDGSYVLTITNLNKVKAAATDSRLFALVFEGKNGATKDDLAAKGALEIVDSFTFTVATGDSMIYVAVLAAVMLAGCAVVVYNKKRSF